jgi:hypothetical protein
MRRTAVLAIGLLMSVIGAGCGSDDEPAAAGTPKATPTATASPEGRFPVAYKVPVKVMPRMDEGDALTTIREEGEVIAATDFDILTGFILADWLRRRDIEVDDPAVLAPTVRGVLEKQDDYLLIVSKDPEVADALEDLRPNKRRLAAFYNGYGGGEDEPFPQAGEAMLDWLRIFRLASRAGDEDHVVIIPDEAG